MEYILSIHSLGTLKIEHQGVMIREFHSKKAIALLIYLAYTKRTYPRSTLSEVFWPERSQAQSLANLRRELAILHCQLNDVLEVNRDCIELSSAIPVYLDAVHFEAESTARSSNLGVAAIHRLQKAIKLYRGDFLEGFYINSTQFEMWAHLERERLRLLAVAVLDRLTDVAIENGNTTVAIANATRLLQIDPLRERAYCQLMCSLARAGEREAALKWFETCQRVLVEDLGVGPSPATTSLMEDIRAGRPCDFSAIRFSGFNPWN